VLCSKLESILSIPQVGSPGWLTIPISPPDYVGVGAVEQNGYAGVRTIGGVPTHEEGDQQGRTASVAS